MSGGVRARERGTLGMCSNIRGLQAGSVWGACGGYRGDAGNAVVLVVCCSVGGGTLSSVAVSPPLSAPSLPPGSAAAVETRACLGMSLCMLSSAACANVTGTPSPFGDAASGTCKDSCDTGCYASC